MSTEGQLQEHYAKKSKHSNYQILPTKLKAILSPESVETRTRFEKERLDYITSQIDFSDKTVLDIGGNTGYFSFELLDSGAKHVTHYEGNKEHSDFVGLAADALGVTDKLTTVNKYYNFTDENQKYDVILLFNVIHHLGDDYGDGSLDVEEAKQEMLNEVNNLRGKCEYLVLQMGFNWHGDPQKPLFANGTKAEMVEFVKGGLSSGWSVQEIAVAQRGEDGAVNFEALNDKNIERDDSLGEFLNRPIFILKSD